VSLLTLEMMTYRSNVDFTKATNDELKTILNHEKYCPTHLLSGAVQEMVRRNMLEDLIFYSAKSVYRNVKYLLQHVLKMDWEELYHIGHIEMLMQAEKFKPGMRTPKTFFIMCLKTNFLKMIRDAESMKRLANCKTKNVDLLDPKLQDKLFGSPLNVEKYVINKIILEQALECLSDKERQAVELYQMGYTQFEVAERLGVVKNYGNVILKRAYQKMRGAIA
jgi:RNA polymerase sigma factor (sigma-70 family)